MKISIIYYSKTGNTEKMANQIREGMRNVSRLDEVRTFSIDAVDESFLEQSDGVIIGTPTYFGSLSGAVKLWLEEISGKVNLSGKLAGAFATAAYVHGGGDIAIQSILSYLMIDGTMTYSGGHAFGEPVIHYGPVALDSELESYNQLFQTYGKRFAGRLCDMKKE